MSHAHASQAIELTARTAFGRLVAWLAWQWKDVAAAEDALSDALLKALEVWPTQGVPASPESWLIAVAKNKLLQGARHQRVRDTAAQHIQYFLDDTTDTVTDVPDVRLKLLFACAHPAIDKSIRTPLMLQTVLGLQVADIAPAMLLSNDALAHRLVRAKSKMRDSGIRIDEPEDDANGERLHAVLEAIYGAFGLGADAPEGATRLLDLESEALYLAELVAAQRSNEPECLGLLALIQFSRARRAAQTDDHGQFVPLTEQDVGRWNRPLILQAESNLFEAAKLRKPGPYQLEAAIHSAHCQRLFTGQTPWKAIDQLYKSVNSMYPTIGSLIAGAVAMAECGNTVDALAALENLRGKETESFQPYWAARAYVLSCLDGSTELKQAQSSYVRAIALCRNPSQQSFLQSRLRLVEERLLQST